MNHFQLINLPLVIWSVITLILILSFSTMSQRVDYIFQQRARDFLFFFIVIGHSTLSIDKRQESLERQKDSKFCFLFCFVFCLFVGWFGKENLITCMSTFVLFCFSTWVHLEEGSSEHIRNSIASPLDHTSFALGQVPSDLKIKEIL